MSSKNIDQDAENHIKSTLSICNVFLMMSNVKEVRKFYLIIYTRECCIYLEQSCTLENCKILWLEFLKKLVQLNKLFNGATLYLLIFYHEKINSNNLILLLFSKTNENLNFSF